MVQPRASEHRSEGRHSVKTEAGTRMLLIGYFSRGNLGDDAMADALKAFLAHEHQDFTVRTRPLPTVRASSWLEVVRFLRDLQWATTVVLAGGTHFHDSYGWRSLRVLVLHWLTVRVVHLVGASLGYAGIGVGPLKTMPARWLAARILKGADAILLRDSRSLGTVGSLLGTTAAIVGFDSAGMLTYPRRLTRQHSIHLGISLVPYFSVFENDPPLDRILVKRIANEVRQAREFLLPRSTLAVTLLIANRQGRIEDRSISEMLQQELGPDLPVGMHLCATAAGTIECLRTMSCLLATRYHVALMGFMMSLPLLVLAYEEKCVALADEILLPDSAVVHPREFVAGDAGGASLCELVTSPGRYEADLAPTTAAEKTRQGLRAFFSALPTQSIVRN